MSVLPPIPIRGFRSSQFSKGGFEAISFLCPFWYPAHHRASFLVYED